jgi:hypothetical protein
MKKTLSRCITAAVGGSAAALTLAACGGTSAPATQVAASASAHASNSPSASPSPASTARLTRKQAAAAYVRIVDHANRLQSLADEDVTDRSPFSQYVSDLRAYLAAQRQVDRELAAVRWPAGVQPYVTALLSTYDPATAACFRAEIRAGSYSADDTVFATNSQCQAAQASTLADTVRQGLGLPARD